MELGENAMLVTIHGKNKRNDTSQANIKKENECFFCKKKRHVKKDCPKFKKWFEKKDNLSSFVCYICI